MCSVMSEFQTISSLIMNMHLEAEPFDNHGYSATFLSDCLWPFKKRNMALQFRTQAIGQLKVVVTNKDRQYGLVI